MTTTEEVWIAAKPGQLRLVQQACSRHLRLTLEAGPPGAQVDELRQKLQQAEYEIPLWLSTLVQAWQGAVAIPLERDFAEIVAVAEKSRERRDALAMMARLGVVSASDVLEMINQWENERE